MDKNKSKKLSKDEMQDVRLLTAMGSMLVNSQEMQEGIRGLVQSAEPVVAVGQLVANMVLKMKEASTAQGLQVSDNIWMAEGGVADNVIDEVVDFLAKSEGVDLGGQEEMIWIECLNVLKLASKAGQGQPQQAGPPQQGVMPQGMAPTAEPVPTSPFGA